MTPPTLAPLPLLIPALYLFEHRRHHSRKRRHHRAQKQKQRGRLPNDPLPGRSGWVELTELSMAHEISENNSSVAARMYRFRDIL